MVGANEGEFGQQLGELPFLIAASHELKAPMALIRQLALSLEKDEALNSEQSSILRQIILSSERGLRLTSDLTKSSRLEDGLFKLEPVNPLQLCEEAAYEMTPLFKAKRRRIVVSGNQHSPLALANRDLLRRIIINFSDNALQYASEESPVAIRVGSYRKGEWIRIGVRDYGPSMPNDIWRRLVSQLGKAPQVIQNRSSSSGLGLYISSQFAAAMNGNIGLVRHRDGATFYVDLMPSKQLSLL